MTRRFLLLALPLCLAVACMPTLQAWEFATAIPTSPPLPSVIPLRPVTPDPALSAPSGKIAFGHLVTLSKDIGKRVAGSPSELKAAQYIDAAFRNTGYEPTWQQFPYSALRENLTVSVKSNNIIAVKPGQARREIIVGAHYDSYNSVGADDNGSGVGVLLEAATRLSSISTPYTIRFIAFGGEEDGFRGSAFFTSKMVQAEKGNTLAMVNLDSLTVGDYLYVHGSRGSEGVIRDWIVAQARARGWDVRIQEGENPDYPPGIMGDFSDQAEFERAGIQVVSLEASNWSLGKKDGYTQVDYRFGVEGQIWNTKYDNLEYIESNFTGRMKERLALAVQLLHAILTEYRE